MNKEIAVIIENVSKRFLLPHEKKNSIKSVFTSIFSSKTTYSTQKALNNINLEIEKGEFFGIVGRNGSGKSTLLKIIANIYQPTSGQVKTAGKLVPFIELGVGFNPELTGRENVYLNGAILGFNRKQITANYKKIVDFAELSEHMDVKLKNYSSGMQVRLAFACATMAEADILLIDEVLAVGDADFQRKCFNFFKHLKKEGTTVIFVTHDMSAVVEYCDRAALINDTRVEMTGSAEDVAEMYTKLFNPTEISDEDIDSESSSSRWGSREMYFISKPKLNIATEFIEIIADVKIDNLVVNPVFGVSIENASGQVVVGTNSKILKKRYKFSDNQKTLQIAWKIPNILGSGKYYVTVAVHSPDGVTVYDRWNGFGSFSYINNYSTSYLVSPSCMLEVNKI